MARRSRKIAERDQLVSPPAQQDEADIIEEVGGVRDDETGEVTVDEDRVLEIGAVDAASVIENRRLKEAVSKKRGGMKGVSFNSDLLTSYEATIQAWPANGLDIFVRRLTGSPVEHVIQSRPRSGAELYAAILEKHGSYEEAKYAVKFLDTNGKQIRGTGQITMPDTRVAPQQGQPMHPYSTPPGYPPPPPGYYPPPPGYAYPSPAPQPAPAAAAPQMAPQPPVVVQAPPGPDMGALMASFEQMMGMLQRMQAQAVGLQPPSMQPAPPPLPAVPATPGAPDMAAMMAWFEQMAAMIQRMQPPSTPARGGAPAPSTTPAATPNPFATMMMGTPPMQAPPGMIWVPGVGFVSADHLFQAMRAAAGGGGALGGAPPTPAYRGPFRPTYGPQGDQGQGPPYPPYSPSAPPARSRSLAEEFRDHVSLVRTVAETAQEFGDMFGGGREAAPAATPAVDEDSPIQIMETGAAKLILNKEDGSLRKWETGWANLDKLIKFGSEELEKFRKSSADREAAGRRALPPGYVEVGPGYQPPPGYVAVPVDRLPPPAPPATSPLPLPPTSVPPPIQHGIWDAPTIPGMER